MTSPSAALKMIALGGLFTAMMGCAAGAYLRPEIGDSRPGPTLIVSATPEPAYLAYTSPDESSSAL